jgi:hypothetical protein
VHLEVADDRLIEDHEEVPRLAATVLIYADQLNARRAISAPNCAKLHPLPVRAVK